MLQKIVTIFIFLFVSLQQSMAAPAVTNSPTHITVGAGQITGLYYPIGGAICSMLNKNTATSGIKCIVEVTEGSIDNVEQLREGKIQFGIVQSDWQYHAFKGSAGFREKGPMDNLRTVFAIHGEPFTVIVHADSKINTLNDLKGKRINIGKVGSGQRATTESLMRALGWHNEDFTSISDFAGEDQISALCDNKVDALITTIGHPNSTLREAALTCPLRIIAIKGPEINKLIELNPFYVPMTIEGGIYKGNKLAIETFGVKATLVTTTEVPTPIVYTLVKTIFDNLARFKRLHPSFTPLTPRLMLVGNSAPYAQGALKYYKEKGWILDIAQ